MYVPGNGTSDSGFQIAAGSQNYLHKKCPQKRDPKTVSDEL